MIYGLPGGPIEQGPRRQSTPTAAAHGIIVRALGPSLGGSGLVVLAEPMVELHGGDGQLIAMNDDWGDSVRARRNYRDGPSA